MLIRLFVENFLSFGERIEFSMVAGKIQQHPDHIIKLEKNSKFNLLKVGAIYGANAAGKSNLIKAMAVIQKLVLKGTLPNQTLPVTEFKLDKELKSKPTRIEVEFRKNNKCYAYGFIADKNTILEEWLYEIGKQKEKRIFSREIDKNKNTSFQFLENSQISKKEKDFLNLLSESTRDNQLFINQCFNHKIENLLVKSKGIQECISWFSDNLVVVFPNTKFSFPFYNTANKNNFMKDFSKFLKIFDTGIDDVEYKKIDVNDTKLIPKDVQEKIRELPQDGKTRLISIRQGDSLSYILYDGTSKFVIHKLTVVHKIVNSEKSESFDLEEESDGTIRMFDLIPLLLDSSNEENVILIDELNRSLHPSLTKNFIIKFLDVYENKNNQIIFTTHEENLLDLDLFRKDEIWFVEKNEKKQSKVYSLLVFKDVRFDKKIKDDYLIGRYGAIPDLLNY